jgi:hypothetical protein
MITSDMRPTPRFVICYGSMDAGDGFDHNNGPNGAFNQWIYIQDGDATMTQGSMVIPLLGGALHDLTQTYGNGLRYDAGVNGVSWLAINPFPDTKRFSCKLLAGPIDNVYQAVDNDRFLLCVRGSLICNNKVIDTNSYGRTSKGKDLNITIGDGSVGLLLEDLG